MIKYVLKRIALLIPIMLGVSAIIFTLKTFTPGDPVRQILGNSASEEQMEAKREELGLDKPVVVQYVNYITGVCRGDFGKSYRTGESGTGSASCHIHDRHLGGSGHWRCTGDYPWNHIRNQKIHMGRFPGTDNFHVLSIGAGVCSGISSDSDIFSTASFTSGNRS